MRETYLFLSSVAYGKKVEGCILLGQPSHAFINIFPGTLSQCSDRCVEQGFVPAKT
jgi:hypothetical protein